MIFSYLADPFAYAVFAADTAFESAASVVSAVPVTYPLV